MLSKSDNKPIIIESIELPKISSLWNTLLRHSRTEALGSSTARVKYSILKSSDEGVTQSGFSGIWMLPTV